ncbi:glycosyltransferase family 2 protein [Rhodobacteraceae bacterium]|nr:glycosyltransferase family 2 protein [Paracoccaceae bacterium]
MQSPISISQVTVVTVAYNSMDVLPRMLASLPPKMPVVVVDNSPNVDPALDLLIERYGAKLIRNPNNRGFGAACNQGAAETTTEFVMFLNPDTEIAPDCFEALIAGVNRFPLASAYAPRITDSHGKIAFRRRANLRPKQEWYRGRPPVNDAEVPVLSGAAILLRKDLFDSVQGFDERIFLYYEDDDLTLRLSKLGPLMHIHKAVVRHLEGHSTERTPELARFKAYHLARSRVFAREKHGRPWPKTEALWRATRQLFSPLMLSKRKRAKYLGYMSGVISTFRDGGKHSDF